MSLSLIAALSAALPQLAGGMAVPVLFKMMESLVLMVETTGRLMGWDGPTKKAKLKALINDWVDLPGVSDQTEEFVIDLLVEVMVYFLFNRHKVEARAQEA